MTLDYAIFATNWQKWLTDPNVVTSTFTVVQQKSQTKSCH